jgi:hypothetical protein
MRIVTGVSADHALIFSEYGPEPVLAAASALLMGLDSYRPSLILEDLRVQMTNGMVDAGAIGERMAAFQYILARDRACLVKERECCEGGAAGKYPLISSGSIE